MDILLLVFVAIISFLFIVYMPTILFHNGALKNNGKEDSIMLFFGASLLFLVFDYLCLLFYDMRAIQKLVECSSIVFNFSCFFGKYLTRVIYTSVPLFSVFFMQVLAVILYSYVTLSYIFKAKKERNVILYMSFFFAVGILGTLIHYLLLNDVFFDSSLAVISLFSSNLYVSMPFIYLVIMVVMNKEQLRIKGKDTVKKK